MWVRPEPPGRRRTRHTLSLVAAPTGELVSLITTLPNALVAEALAEGRIAELTDWETESREYTHGRSRFDFLLKRVSALMLLEVKSVTLVDGDRALFPDAVTARGARHLRELVTALKDGFAATVLFVVQRSAACSMRPARDIDPVFADALGQARAAGVAVLAYRSEVTLQTARITGSIPVLSD